MLKEIKKIGLKKREKRQAKPASFGKILKRMA